MADLEESKHKRVVPLKRAAAPAAQPQNVPSASSVPEPVQPKIMKQHKVAAGETLSHIALKYYGSAVKGKWMVIYEANKSKIGDNPNKLAIGLVLDIPELPEK